MRIGSVEIPGRLVLAPMAGVTDLAFRTICRELGAGYTVTEMVSAKALCYQDKKTSSLLKLGEGEHPCAVQLFGSDPACVEEAAAMAGLTEDQVALITGQDGGYVLKFKVIEWWEMLLEKLGIGNLE